MEQSNFPLLSLEYQGEITKNNLGEFRIAVTQWLDGLPENPQTDEEFAAAEQAVKILSAAEKELKARSEALFPADIQAALKECREIESLLSSRRLSLNKAVVSAKAEKKECLIQEALSKLPGYREVQAHFAEVFGDAVKGKKSIKAIKAALEIEVSIAHREIAEKDGDISEFCRKYGWALIPDKGALLTMHRDALESELRRRKEAMEAQERERELQAKLDAEKEARSKEQAEKVNLETKAEAPQEATEAQHEAPPSGDEWQAYRKTVANVAYQLGGARAKLTDKFNVDCAKKLRDMLALTWGEIVAERKQEGRE